jgi:hypothetical protein
MHKSVFNAIDDALDQALMRSANLEELLQRNTEPLPISAWGLWLIFCLVRHEQRQQWVGEIAVSKLGVDLDLVSRAGLAHPEIEQSGLVPGMTDWEYHLHGCGCCLTNRLTGESIDVDFVDGSAEWFDRYFFIWFLKSLKAPQLCERRLIELHPTLETVVLTFAEVCDLGLVHTLGNRKSVQLAPDCRQWAEKLERLNEVHDEPIRLAEIGVAFDDWPLVYQQFKTTSVGERVERCFARQRRRLLELFADPNHRRDALAAIADLGGTDSKAALNAALGDRAGGTVSMALNIIEARNDEDWSNSVIQILRNTNPNGNIPEPYIWISCARYLLRREKHRPEIEKGLERMKNRELGDAALLALEFVPDLAVALFRRALRSSVPIDRTTAAAALAILDRPWANVELIAVLNESDDQEKISECRAALYSMADTRLHEVVKDWEERHPHEPETGRFISMTERSLRMRGSFLQSTVEKLHDQVLPLRDRDVSPRQRSRRWWQFW